MCHNAPWLSVLDKQMRLQFAPKESKADVMSEFWSRDVHGNGIPMGMGIPWESHGNPMGMGTQICQKWEWEWEEYT